MPEGNIITIQNKLFSVLELLFPPDFYGKDQEKFEINVMK